MNKLILTTLLAATASVSAEKPNILDSLDTKIQNILSEKSNHENRGGVTVVTVGPTGDCDYNSGTTRIQDAIDSGADEVRVKTGFYNESIVINDIDLKLKGGYATCAAAVADNQTEIPTATVISAANEGATVFISGNMQSNSVEIDHFRITGGTVSGATLGGGIASLNADTSLSLSELWISENASLIGGGLSIVGDDTGVTAYNVMIIDNSAQSGGGVACAGSSSIFLYGAENNLYGINSNEATTGSGGGVYLNGCGFTSTVGGSGIFDFRGINSNSAAQHGGGIFASGGSQVNLFGNQECAFIFCFGNDSQPVSIRGNTADSDDSGIGNGGGIYATGLGSVVNVYNGLIANNEAKFGGGVSVNNQSFFFTNTIFKKGINCWNPGSCSQIKGNHADNNGGAVNVDEGSFAEIYRTHIQENRANYGTAFYATGSSSSIITEGSLITGNGDNGADGFIDASVLEAQNNATIELRFTTLADNNMPNNGVVIHNNTAITNIYSSIIHETNDDILIERITPTGYDFDCVVVHERDSFPGGFAVVVADPQFVDRANGDYHLNWMTSPAIDFCDDDQIAPAFTDIDNETRGFDWPNIPNNVGSYDVGFDEQNDIIFANGFEDPSL